MAQRAKAKNAASSYPFFGEIGMLTNTVATAAVRTSCACTLLGVSRANFPAFLSTSYRAL